MSVIERLEFVATSEKARRFRMVTADLRWTYLGFAALTAFMSAGTILSDVLLDDNPNHRQHQAATLHVSFAIAVVSVTFLGLAVRGWLSKWLPLAVESEPVVDGTVWPPPPKPGT